ncbi:unnamed protein product [Thelazia callipaeda]|uniref:Ovule protein n=1 Tax=Thelazia callipaeda TaxID=103827 RepID=A0A0N5D5V7_THECL|nr:unnamed protein product [Thelazia callipaeda]
MCYSEYIAIEQSDKQYLHKFDRFCAYTFDCVKRNLHNRCLSIDQLSARVLTTLVIKICCYLANHCTLSLMVIFVFYE